VAVRAPGSGSQQTRILEDLAVLTGGRCVLHERGDRLADVTTEQLGKARQAWATRFAFGILGGRGERAAIRRRIDEAKAELARVGDDDGTRKVIAERIGKLAGTAAVIRVGAPSASERQDLKLRIEAAVRTAHSAARTGVVSGGGAALLACTPALESLDGTADELFGIKALARALAEPMRVIASNGGLEPNTLICEARTRGLPWTFDVVGGEWSASLMDPLGVLETALESAVSLVMTALTADVLIHRTSS
jgi:chaperonin GroEL